MADEKPNTRSLARMKQDLTTAGPKHNKDETTVFTYSFDYKPQPGGRDDTLFRRHDITALYPMGEVKLVDNNNYYRAYIREALDKYERAANVKFVEKPGGKPANHNYFLSDNMRKEMSGYFMQHGDSPGALVFRKDVYFYTTRMHEIGHALKLRHPDEQKVAEGKKDQQDAWRTGGHSAYDAENTLMSYNIQVGDGAYITHCQTELGPADLATLQYLYGPPKIPPIKQLRSNELPPVIYSTATTPITLHIMPEKPMSEITLPEKGTENGVRKIGQHRLAWETYIDHVLVSDHINTSVTLTGNSASNLLFGGSGDDVLRPVGINDRVSGGRGADRFELREGNLGTVIQDFSAAEHDSVTLPTHAHHLGIRPTAAKAPASQGTSMQVMDAKHTVIADALFEHMTVEQLREAMKVHNLAIEEAPYAPQPQLPRIAGGAVQQKK